MMWVAMRQFPTCLIAPTPCHQALLSPFCSSTAGARSFLALVLLADRASLAARDAPDLVSTELGKPEVATGPGCDLL